MQRWTHVSISIIGEPTDADLERYLDVHLTGPHAWDPSVLDYTHPSGDGEPPWSNDTDERFAFDSNFDEYGDYTYQHDVNHEAPDYSKFRPYFGWVNVDTVQKTMEHSTHWGVSLPTTFPMKST